MNLNQLTQKSLAAIQTAQSIAAQRDHNTLTHEKHLNLFRIYTF